jgi:hypothetical protein
MTRDSPSPPWIDVGHAANATVSRFLGVADPGLAQITAAADVDRLALGTHPELVDHLWSLLGDASGASACVIDGRSLPLLASPERGVIFALAGGTSTLAVRLPEPELSEALAVPGYGGDRNQAWCRRSLAHAETLV